MGFLSKLKAGMSKKKLEKAISGSRGYKKKIRKTEWEEYHGLKGHHKEGKHKKRRERMGY